MNDSLQITFYVLLAISLVIRLLTWLTRDDTPPVSYLPPPLVTDSQRLAGTDLEEDKSKDDLTDDQIDDFIKILREKLPNKPTAHNLPFVVKHHEGMDKWGNDKLENYYTKRVNEICDFIFLYPAIKTLFVTSIDVPAKYVYYDGVHLLEINLSLLHPNIHCAVISRELTRYYLKLHNIVLPDIQSNNYLFDIATVYLGFGFQILNARNHLILEGPSLRYGLDLLKPIKMTINRDSIMRAIVATAKVRKQQPYFVISQFHSQNRTWAKRRLFELIQEYKAHKGEGLHTNHSNEFPNPEEGDK